MYRQALARADVITACSGQTLREAEEFFGKSLATQIACYLQWRESGGVPERRPARLAAAVYPGDGPARAAEGIRRPIAAFAKAGHATHDLLLAGDGPQRAALQTLAIELGVADAVRFTGAVDHAEAVSLFAGCSLFVLPSRHEPMGIVNLEAMAAGKAVVASEVGGVPELVAHDQNGLLVPRENVDAMAAAISRLMNDGELRARMGRAGRRRAEEFSCALWPISMNRLILRP